MAVMKVILKHLAALPTLLALTVPVAAQENERRAGGLEPLESGEMEAALVPLEKPPEEGSRAYERWLEEQRRRLQEDTDVGRYEPQPRRNSSAEDHGLSPFQQQFRDSLIDQMRNNADQFR